MKLAILMVSLVPSVALAAKVPAWCSAIGDARLDTSGTIKDAIEDDDPRNALRNLVARFCKPDADVEDAYDELEASRKKWSARLDLTEADWADVAEYATLGQGPRMGGEVGLANDSDETRKRAWSSFDPIDQYVWINSSYGASGALSLDWNYLTDAFGQKLSEIGRLAYIRKCLRGDEGAVQWAMCQGDIEKLDLKKLAAELRANKTYGGHEKMRIRIAAADAKQAIAEHDAKIKKLIAGDPGYAKVFELAAATRKEWEGRYQSDAALLELASRMDDARATNSRKGFAGCEDTTWAAWKSAVGAIPAKKYEGMHDDRKEGKRFLDTAMRPIINDPSAYLAAVALATCMTVGREHNAEQDVLVRRLGGELEYWPGFRGPRTAAESAILGAGITLDDRDAKLKFPSNSRPFGGRSYSTSGGGAGVVANLKPNGKTTTVEFKKQMVRQVQCAESRDTHKIVQIRSDGTLVYESVCVRNETVVVDKSDAPQAVNPRYLEGVKPGMFVSITEDVVIGVWAKPDSATPLMVFGVPLK